MSNFKIRQGIEKDLAGALQLINELAAYEKAPEEVDVTLPLFLQYFREGLFEFILAEENEKILGIALFYTAYSTWKGKIIYLDDLVVTNELRRSGIGSSLFDALVKIARQKGANQLRWHVLDWNTPAIEFYKRLEASLDPEWITCKLTKQQITRLANQLTTNNK